MHWPLFDLRLRTPRLELRLPSLTELEALAQLSTEGVHDPDLMPFNVPWTDLPPEGRARSVMQFHWLQMASWTGARLHGPRRRVSGHCGGHGQPGLRGGLAEDRL